MNDNRSEMLDLEVIYDLYFDKIYKFFYYKTLSKESAEDLSADTFIHFADALRKNKGIEDKKKFLFGIAKNIFMQFLRDKYRREIPFSNFSEDFYEYADNLVSKVEEKKDFSELILKYINMIPPKQGKVLMLRLVDKLTLSEICERLGKDMNYVKTTQRRAIRSLREYVQENLEEVIKI